MNTYIDYNYCYEKLILSNIYKLEVGIIIKHTNYKISKMKTLYV